MDPTILIILLAIGAYLYTDAKKSVAEEQLKEAKLLITSVAEKMDTNAQALMSNVANGGLVALNQMSAGGINWGVVSQASTGADRQPNWNFVEDEDFWLNFLEQDEFGKALDEGWDWLEDALISDEELNQTLSLAGFEFKVEDNIGYVRHDDPMWGAANWIKQVDYIKANPQMFK
jgi:hypothetical protein